MNNSLAERSVRTSRNRDNKTRITRSIRLCDFFFFVITLDKILLCKKVQLLFYALDLPVNIGGVARAGGGGGRVGGSPPNENLQTKI